VVIVASALLAAEVLLVCVELTLVYSLNLVLGEKQYFSGMMINSGPYLVLIHGQRQRVVGRTELPF